jgi:outer membrane protein OmpA-like peptidoglycan-associated protein
MKKKAIVMVMVMLITMFPLFAEFDSGTAYIGSHISAIQLMGGNDNSQVKAWWGLDFNYFFNPVIGTELSASMGWVRPDNSSMRKDYITYLYPVNANLKFNFLSKGKFIPYGLVGAGMLYWDVRDVTDVEEGYPLFKRDGWSIHGCMQKDVIANAGLGFHYFLSKNFVLESSFRYHMIVEAEKDMSGYGNHHSGLWEVRMGLGVVFGNKKPKVDTQKLERERQAKLDAEAAERNRIAKLEAEKAEAERQSNLNVDKLEKEKQARLDSEKLEREKQTRLEAERREKEKQLEAEKKENERLALLESQKTRDIVSQTIFFLVGGFKITDTEKVKLTKIIQILKENPTIRVEIQGYSDITGTRELNMRLTKERADSVKNYLIENGIQANRLTSVGYGPDNPISTNDTNEGRARNRRVEFKILK